MSIPSESVIIKAISHDIRREILRMVNIEPRKFTDLLNFFDISTGKLNYHLNQIQGFIMKNEETSLYGISSLGLKALEILDMINQDIQDTDQSLLKKAFISQKEASSPLALQGINISIGMICFFIIIHILLSIIVITDPKTPFIVPFLLAAILIGEVLILIWLFRIKKSIPTFLNRFFKHLNENQ
ncbi:MAG: ArsR family transcriptional regulator [Candidatus Heimdallarchaeota archaeon]|nr:ArsR family transcriptional regulator [Candidatus Heimdallarchaeota archaeon]